MPLAVGTRLGPYEIIAPIGSGGMGEVYRARDTRLDRLVAVKILPAEFGADATFKLRFDREARAIAQVAHPNICTLFDVGENYIVMELLDGEPLSDRLTRGALPLRDAAAYGAQIAEALGQAHHEGIVHRDVKPGNIMLTKSGVKLLDFGLAKTNVVRSDAVTDLQPVTEKGQVLGTLQYMAPEQLSGEEPDARSDIFSLGAVLYEMATGRRAFEGNTKPGLIAAILTGQPPPMAEIHTRSPALEHIVEKCLAKDPERRWQSAMDVAGELRWISEGGSQESAAFRPPPQRRARKRLWMAVLAIAVVAVAALAAVLVSMRTRPRPFVASVVVPQGTTLDLENTPSLTLSPDGNYVTFAVQTADGNSTLWLRRLDTGEARPVAENEGAAGMFAPFWSPDSKQMAFFGDRKLQRIDVGGGPAVTLAPASDNARGGSWNRDGVIIFAPAWADRIYRVAATGGPVQPVTAFADGEGTHRWPVFLSDGEHFLYLAFPLGQQTFSERNATYVGSLHSSERRLLMRGAASVRVVDDYVLFSRDKYLLVQRFNSRSQTLDGEPVSLARKIASNYSSYPALSATNDLLAYYERSESQLAWYDRTGKEVEAVGAPADYRSVRLAPAEAAHPSFVFQVDNLYANLWIYDVAQHAQQQLTTGSSNKYGPVWSPDGKQVAFRDTRSSRGDLYVKSLAGGSDRLLAKFDDTIVPTDWSHDGRFLAVAVPDRGRYAVWLVAADGVQKPYPFITTDLGRDGAGDGHFSPDMRWFTFSSDESGRSELYAVSFPDKGERRQLTTDGIASRHAWTADGKEILYAAADRTVMSIVIKDGTFSKPAALFKAPESTVAAATPDGERFLFARPTNQSGAITLVTNWRALLEKK